MPAASRAVADPSWITVIGTTLRLWLRRRVLRVPDSGRVGAGRLTTLALVVVVVAAAITAGAIALASGSPAPAKSAAAPPRHHAPKPPAVSPQQLATEAGIAAAATWIKGEVAATAVVDCDPYTGGELVAAGFPAGQENVLETGAPLPPVPASPLGGPAATLLVTTPGLRTQYGGASLAATAPVLLATFGTGPQAVQVRLTVPGGASAAQHDAATALRARRSAGRALAHSKTAHMHSAAQHQLAAGQVDPRLTSVLRKLTAAQQVYIMGFGSPAAPSAQSGQSAGGPAAVVAPGGLLRQAQLDGLIRKQDGHTVSELKAVLHLLRTERAPDRPAIAVSHEAGGRVVVTISFPLPSPY